MEIIRPFTVVPGGLTSNVAEADYAAYSAASLYVIGNRVMYDHRNYESLTGTSGIVTMTIASPVVVSRVAHGWTVGMPVKFSTTGALPTGLVAGTIYYIIAAGFTASAFQVSATLGGAAINTSGTQSGTHTATASSNFNQTPDASPSVWLDMGATNRWSMFDTSVQSQTTNANSIDAVITLGARVDSVALVNFSSASVQITMTDPVDGVVYDEVFPTVSTEGIVDLYTYFFEPITRITDLAVTGLPPYASGTLRVLLDDAGGTAKCGGCILGQTLKIGDTEVGAKVGVQDYSIKTRDNFGNYVIVERAFNKRANFTVHIPSSMVDKLQNLLSSYRAVPIVYIGSTQWGATMVYGFYKSFEIEIGYSDGLSVCSLEVEGLT